MEVRSFPQSLYGGLRVIGAISQNSSRITLPRVEYIFRGEMEFFGISGSHFTKESFGEISKVVRSTYCTTANFHNKTCTKWKKILYTLCIVITSNMKKSHTLFNKTLNFFIKILTVRFSQHFYVHCFFVIKGALLIFYSLRKRKDIFFFHKKWINWTNGRFY